LPFNERPETTNAAVEVPALLVPTTASFLYFVAERVNSPETLKPEGSGTAQGAPPVELALGTKGSRKEP
jgi:hypothetical protein